MEHKETHPSSAASFLLIVVPVRLMATKQHNVGLSDDLAAAIERAVAERGYEFASAFMCHAIQKELRHDANAVADVEERIAATLNRQAKELRSVHTALRGAASSGP